MSKSLEEVVNDILDKTIPLMEVSQVLSHNEAYERGSKLLMAQGRLTNIWKQYADQLIVAKSQEEVAMHGAISTAEGKDADARKAAAKANPDRQKAAEEVARLENNIAYVQSFMRQFENSYRVFMAMVKNDAGL